MFKSGHSDTFTRDNLPTEADWPELLFDLPELKYPERLNCAAELLTGAIDNGFADRPAIVWADSKWTYRQLDQLSNRIAHALTADWGLVPGGRVLLRGSNSAMMIACWYGVLKAGGVVVTTMPMLRAPELKTILVKAHIKLALCEESMLGEMHTLGDEFSDLQTFCFGTKNADLEQAIKDKPGFFAPCDTAQDDVALLAFTSGTTGQPKACMHFHRDVLAMADGYAAHILEPTEHDVFCGSPPIAFTFGLGAIVVFPARFGSAVALPSANGADALLDTIETHSVTMLFTAPTAYRALLNLVKNRALSSLRCCISAGETLPAATWHAWKDKTGLSLMDGIGATEMIHIFLSAKLDEIRPGFTGKAVPGYHACLMDNAGNILPPPAEGRLAVKGPTGCRYMADDRQKAYVVNGWNVTGDTYRQDEDGYFAFVARSDDMIISSGYNIGGPEVEEALLNHPLVKECAVIGVADEKRGQIVKAYIVSDAEQNDALVKSLQDHVKQSIAPYKYPRAIEFLDSLPKTQTGKVQRYKLRPASTPPSTPVSTPAPTVKET